MVEVTDVPGMPTGIPSTGPVMAMAGICAQLAERSTVAGNDGLEDLLRGVHAKLDAPGETSIRIVIMNGRVQSCVVEEKIRKERIYFPREEMDGPQTEE